MKKLLFSLLAIVLILCALSLLAWNRRAGIAAHFLAKELHVPVSIRTLEITQNQADIASLWVGNPRHSKTSTSFSTEQMSIVSTLDQILGNPLVIDAIELSNIYVGIEFYDREGTDSNWSRILNVNETTSKKQSRDYLIRTLVLTNLTVEVTQADGRVKRYPTISRMEFHNITSETGFPVSEIEKAIFDLVMKDIFRKLNLNQLLKTIDPTKTIKKIPLF